MSAELVVAIVSLVVSILTALFTGYLAFAALRITAKPRLTASVEATNGVGSAQDLVFHAGKVATLRFNIRNIGHWYAKPAATETQFWVNFEPALEPIVVRHGERLDRIDDDFGFGGDGHRFYRVDGRSVNYMEPPRRFEVDLRLPPDAGIYRGWLTIYAQEGDCGVHKFQVVVK